MTPTQEAIARVRADLACGTALISNTESARDLRLVLTAAEEAERLRSALRELVDAKAAWDATRMPGGGLRYTKAWNAARAIAAQGEKE